MQADTGSSEQSGLSTAPPDPSRGTGITPAAEPANAAQGDLARDRIVRSALVIAVVAIAVLLPARSLLLRPITAAQDEGLLLTYPARILAGDVANRDFQSVYGAASLATVAGAFRAFGTSVTVERLVGLAYHLVLVGAMTTWAWRRRGRFAALVVGVLTAVMLIPTDLTAYAWLGGLALCSVALVLLDVSWWHPHRRWLRWVAGACLGLSLAFRLDLAFAVALVLLAVAIARRRAVTDVAWGFAVGVVPILVTTLRAGMGNVVGEQVLDPIFVSGPGRRLPLHSLGPLLLIALLVCVTTATAWVVCGAERLRRDPGSAVAASWLVLGCLELGLLPQALQRADLTHLAFAACIIAPSAVLLPWPVEARRAPTAVAASASVLLVLLSPNIVDAYADHTASSFGIGTHSAHLVRHDGRSVPLASAGDRAALRDLLAAVDARTAPGDRVFVGPNDLRRTNYNDTYLYFLLPDLVPATRHLEMDPGVANGDDSGLADDLRGSDVVILTSRYDGWSESNESSELGPRAPERALADDFSPVGSWGPWTLYERRP